MGHRGWSCRRRYPTLLLDVHVRGCKLERSPAREVGSLSVPISSGPQNFQDVPPQFIREHLHTSVQAAIRNPVEPISGRHHFQLFAASPTMPNFPLPEHHLIVNTYTPSSNRLASAESVLRTMLPLSVAFSSRRSVVRSVVYLHMEQWSDSLSLLPSADSLCLPILLAPQPVSAHRLLHLELTRMFRRIQRPAYLPGSRQRDGRLKMSQESTDRQNVDPAPGKPRIRFGTLVVLGLAASAYPSGCAHCVPRCRELLLQ